MKILLSIIILINLFSVFSCNSENQGVTQDKVFGPNENWTTEKFHFSYYPEKDIEYIKMIRYRPAFVQFGYLHKKDGEGVMILAHKKEFHQDLTNPAHQKEISGIYHNIGKLIKTDTNKFFNKTCLNLLFWIANKNKYFYIIHCVHRKKLFQIELVSSNENFLRDKKIIELLNILKFN